ncbi:MAG TPA: lysophospholipid acyltransferase family protein [Candidatus Brocadiia bacterium]|nr:lysophospholipid acyltransferase family protein [Candidatus Brocadiia bacterium]
MERSKRKRVDRGAEAPNGNATVWRASRLLVWTLFNATCGLRYLKTGFIPREGAFILAANHNSYLDPILISPPVNRPVSYLTASQYTGPIFPGLLMRPYGVVPVREDATPLQLYSISLRILKSGRPIGIFPEGTRSLDGSLGEFQPGMARLATATGAQILPVTIIGSYQAWPRMNLLPDFQPVTVIYHEPVRPRSTQGMPKTAAREYERQLTKQVRDAIASGYGMVRRTVRAWEPV